MPGKGKLTRLYRPVKKASDQRRRRKVQFRRLVALGVPEDKVRKLNPRQIRELLKRPAKIARQPA
jgi:hypothetical protein